jgi:hypothetical protein
MLANTSRASLAKAYATQPFVWMLGGIIGSAMGGFLAQPAHFYPSLFPADGLFGRYPYLLPNLVSATIVVLVIIQGIFLLEETNPRGGTVEEDEEDHAVQDDDVADETTPLHSQGRRARPSAVENMPPFIEEGLPLPIQPNFDLRRASFGSSQSIKPAPNTRPGPPSRLQSNKTYDGPAFNYTIIMLTIALVIIAYHQMAFGTLLPTYILDKPSEVRGRLDLHGGLGYTVHDVGTYLAVNGVMGLLIQGLIFPAFVAKMGVRRSFFLMILLYPTAYMINPFLSALPVSLVSPGIFLGQFLQSFYGIISAPCALIMLKDATPSPLVLGKVNGLAMSASCLARTVSPPLVGIIYSTGGSAAAWFSLVGFAAVGSLQLLWLRRE